MNFIPNPCSAPYNGLIPAKIIESEEKDDSLLINCCLYNCLTILHDKKNQIKFWGGFGAHVSLRHMSPLLTYPPPCATVTNDK